MAKGRNKHIQVQDSAGGLRHTAGHGEQQVVQAHVSASTSTATDISTSLQCLVVLFLENIKTINTYPPQK